MTYKGQMDADEVRKAALDAFVNAERTSDPENRASWAAVGAGYARIYAADVAGGR